MVLWPSPLQAAAIKVESRHETLTAARLRIAPAKSGPFKRPVTHHDRKKARVE
jgi:hypothetical protein